MYFEVVDPLIKVFITQDDKPNYNSQIQYCLRQLRYSFRIIIITQRRSFREEEGYRGSIDAGEIEGNFSANSRWVGNWPIFGRASG